MRTSSRTSAYFLSLLVAPYVQAQELVPFVSNAERFMVFCNKRFVEVDDRPPMRYWAMDGAVLFQPIEGGLVQFTWEGQRMEVIERRAVRDVQVAGQRAAWVVDDTLKVLRSGAAVPVASGVDRYMVSDSLIAFVDGPAGELNVLWRGQRILLAAVGAEVKDLRWTQGTNSVSFFDRSEREVVLFQHGAVRTLTDSVDVGYVVAGNGMLAYWDDTQGEFIGEGAKGRTRLSGLRPISAKAGDGLLAFVDGTVKLKCWREGKLITLTDSMPSEYWVQDRVVLYLQGGKLMVLAPDGPMAVDDIVPEQWKVQGELLVYLNANRELWGIRNGERMRFGKEAAIDGFDLHGGAVVYKSPTGSITVVSGGRTFVY